MVNYGIKVSKEGYGVDADIENITFSSSYPFFKIHSDTSTSVMIPTPNTSGSVSVSHDLGYVPAFLAYVSYWADDYERPIPQGVAAQPYIITAYATSSAIVCRVNFIGSDQDRTFYFRVLIFKDKIS